MAEPDLGISDDQYREIRERLVTFFRVHRRADPELYADEVIYRAVRRLREGATADPSFRAFCLGVARNVLRESLKEKTLQEISKDPPDESGGGFAQLTRVEQAVLLNECLHCLPAEEQKLLLEYHLGDRALLATRRNQSPNALRIQVHRIARKVLKFVLSPPDRGESGPLQQKRPEGKSHK